ncbi:unnamed protein product [Microthlaspi erraticum]|uniref:Uncharacterized protein n=1 Tax=Microthlaspi erraticum TaxID=1685480 RepID=A0A6D2KWD7_9BRAS|nr:unnamed protein product [Microthlaspi erraticum]
MSRGRPRHKLLNAMSRTTMPREPGSNVLRPRDLSHVPRPMVPSKPGNHVPRPAEKASTIPSPVRPHRPTVKSSIFEAQSAQFKPKAGADLAILGLVAFPYLVFWSILEHMGHEEHGGTWRMDAAQLDTQRKKGEAILKTSSTIYSTNRSSSSTRPAKLQLDRAEKSKSNPKNVASPLTFL